jgi:hypothetical protein
MIEKAGGSLWGEVAVVRPCEQQPAVCLALAGTISHFDGFTYASIAPNSAGQLLLHSHGK